LNGSAKKVKGSLKDNTVRYPMTSQIFSALDKAVERPCRSLDWFGLAEHVVNTVYALGQHPDEWCGSLIKKLAARAFGPRENRDEPMNKENEDNNDENDGGDDDGEGERKKGYVDEDGDVSMTQADMSFTQPALTQNAGEGKRTADNFEMSQLFFVIGHVALKQIVFLELVEREWKRQKDETQANGGQSTKDKDGEELDQVAGNAEDEIGDRIQAIREVEILYGEESLLAAYAQMIVRVCGSPQIFKVYLMPLR
jgi:condensin complex subunit 1